MIHNLQQFIKDVIKEAGMDSLPKKFLDEYEDKLMIEAQRRMGVLMVKELNEQSIKEFDQLMQKLMQKNSNFDQKILENFFNQHIPDFKMKLEKGLEDFKLEFIQELTQLKSRINK